MAADATGAALPAAHVTLRDLATGEELFAQADLEAGSGFPAFARGAIW